MHRRKIQLIAGSTYSLSLPKTWVKENKLKEKQEVLIYENNDKTLSISPTKLEKKSLDEITIEIDEYADYINQILFAIYYLGIENITLHTKGKLSKEMKAKIRITLTYMSGTEITYEDDKKIKIKVLLDKSKIDIKQIMYRLGLIIESSLANLTDRKEIKANENEIDRLYHLMTKIIATSLLDQNVLRSSNITNISLIPSYLLIGKKLENIGDNLNHLSSYLRKNKLNLETKKDILDFLRNELNKSIKNITYRSKTFKKIPKDELKKINNSLAKITDGAIFNYLKDTLRYIIDIEDEILNIMFYNKLIKEGAL